MIKNICCIGAGYVGGPTMAVIALKCPHINVTVVDANSERIEAWNGPLDTLPIYEPGLSEIVGQVRNKNLFFSNDIRGAIEKSEMIFMAVNTPTKTEGEGAGMAADLRFIESCARDIAKYSNSEKIVVEKSTVPIRTAEKIKDILDQNEKGIHFEILSNPEFLAEGSAIDDMVNPSRVLIGGEKTTKGINALNQLSEVYSSWVESEKIITTNVWSSELAKLASNAMLAQRISSINSLSALCEKTGADIDELSKAIGSDHRIGPHFLKASVGFGGSCFQKDILNLVYLCKYYGLDEVAEYWHQVVRINDYQKKRFSKKIINYFKGDLNGIHISLLGWSFKANTNDSRESPSIKVAIDLLKAGAKLKVFDPMIKENQIKKDLLDSNIEFTEDLLNIKLEIKDSIESAIYDTDGIAILTEWKQFKEFDWNNYSNSRKSSVIIFDGRNIIQNKNIKILNLN